MKRCCVIGNVIVNWNVALLLEMEMLNGTVLCLWKWYCEMKRCCVIENGIVKWRCAFLFKNEN
jgi:hypothetical protein